MWHFPRTGKKRSLNNTQFPVNKRLACNYGDFVSPSLSPNPLDGLLHSDVDDWDADELNKSSSASCNSDELGSQMSSESNSENSDISDDDGFGEYTAHLLKNIPCVNNNDIPMGTIPCFKYDAVFDIPHVNSKRPVAMSATETLQLLWYKKHHITEECMSDFINLVQHSSFNSDDLKSISTIKRRIACLPINPSYGLDVPRVDVDLHNSDGEEMDQSASQSQFAFVSLKDKLRRVLQHPALREKVERTNNARFSSQVSEFCHGRRYMESPFFTFDSVEIRPGEFVELGDRLLLASMDNKPEDKYRLTGIALDESNGEHVLKIRRYRHVTDSHLPRLGVTKRRQLGIPLISSGNVTDIVYTEEEIFLRDLSRIIRVCHVGPGLEFNCDWAVQGTQWKPILEIDSHPCDFEHHVKTVKLAKEAERNGFRIYRFFLVLYIDGFGLFQRAAHTTDGIYMTLGNFDRRDRHDLSNLWTLGMWFK